MTTKRRIFKTAKIQEKRRRFATIKGVKKVPVARSNYNEFWAFLPKQVVKSHGWKKGDKIVFIPIDGLIEAQEGDIIIRRLNHGK